MKVPTFIDTPVVGKDGKLTDQWKNIFMELFTQMQKNISDDGLVAPSRTSSDITAISSTDNSGAILYDQENNLLKANINGEVKTIKTE